jgi:carboxypeptidase Q
MKSSFSVAISIGTVLLAGLAFPAGSLSAAKPSSLTLEQGASLLAERALASDDAFRRLAFLCDHIGYRLAGSPAYMTAVDWALKEMAAIGLAAHSEPVTVPHWERGLERVQVLSPLPRLLHVKTLGGSVGTPQGGIDADLVAVSSFDELHALGGAVKGHIVLFDPPFESYGQAVAYRAAGAIETAKLGGLAALVRSPTPMSLATPHTGGLSYTDGVPQVPGVGLTAEDAGWLHRLVRDGTPVRMHLDLGAHMGDPVVQANVVGELKGREKPGEFVVLACHLDSWDVGQGAQDDGAGCAVVMEAGRLLATLPVHPRRSVRVVLFANEERGLNGGKALLEAHGAEVPHTVAALESDLGSGAIRKLEVGVQDPSTGKTDEAATERFRASLAGFDGILAGVGLAGPTAGDSGADISPLVHAGVPGIGLDQDGSGYWPIHHTDADTLDKVDPIQLRKNAAAVAVTAWLLAEAPGVESW